MPIRALEFFSGIGGLRLAFERSNVNGTVVRAYDFDKMACQVYSLNYDDVVIQADISKLTTSSLALLRADLWLMSPPCQPYTILSSGTGSADPRATPFIHLFEILLPDLISRNAHPRYLLVENVAGFETSDTKQQLLSTLKTLQYQTFECLLTPLQFGVPNSRLRYYLLAKMGPVHFPCSQTADDKIWRHIPRPIQEGGRNGSKPSIELCHAVKQIRQYLDDDDGGNHSLYLVPDRVLMKWGRLFDIVLPTSRRSCCFTRGYTKLVERAGSILQINENLDTKLTFDRFLQAQVKDDLNAIDILRPLQLRYFTPAELLRISCFQLDSSEETFRWPPGITTKTKYRLIGNSVNVKVVTELINYLFM